MHLDNKQGHSQTTLVASTPVTTENKQCCMRANFKAEELLQVSSWQGPDAVEVAKGINLTTSIVSGRLARRASTSSSDVALIFEQCSCHVTRMTGPVPLHFMTKVQAISKMV